MPECQRATERRDKIVYILKLSPHVTITAREIAEALGNCWGILASVATIRKDCHAIGAEYTSGRWRLPDYMGS